MSYFIEQVQILMEIQQMKLAEVEHINEKSKYYWLCTKKVPLVKLPLKLECKIRQALRKVTLDEQAEILKKLMKWINGNIVVDVIKIPEVTLDIINNTVTINMVNETNFSRMNSFRNSLRRFSTFSNRITPNNIPVERNKCVTFQDQYEIYNIKI